MTQNSAYAEFCVISDVELDANRPTLYAISMHIFFSGIGGTAIGPLALIAKQAGFEVSGSDKQDSQYITYLKKHGITNIHIGQSAQQIAHIHEQSPIDWYVYSSAVAIENPNAPEMQFCREQNIKMSKRDELINFILQEKKLKMVAVGGTHGKTTTTAMVIWLFKQLKVPVSYSVGAKIPFGDMGQYEEGAHYFVYEADEFDRNFLAFEPYLSLITGVSWDHHEIFPTRESYQQAFADFLGVSTYSILWEEDKDYLEINPDDYHHLAVLNSEEAQKADRELQLFGHYNRLDAWLAIQAVHEITQQPTKNLVQRMKKFPGLQRRMEEIAPHLYSDYAHTPDKIRGAMSAAVEIATSKKQAVVVVYEPLTDRRQHYMIDDYKDCFASAKKVYWLPSYLAREDPNQRIIPPEELISHLSDPSLAEARGRDESLKQTIQKHLDSGDMVVAMAGGGGDSLDEWIRENFIK
jgi:UDP-N-acetylmuramate--alanine ligase